uniref:Coenzyme F420 hydrogenase/dehydrogenase beta subunit N-terminal domain-containing protein n=1 Tax=Cucumis melo TaxID=3656 RepID=A0A9I9E467_CUCME
MSISIEQDGLHFIDPEDRPRPRPILARTQKEVFADTGVKPTLTPNLNTLALVEVLFFFHYILLLFPCSFHEEKAQILSHCG